MSCKPLRDHGWVHYLGDGCHLEESHALTEVADWRSDLETNFVIIGRATAEQKDQIMADTRRWVIQIFVYLRVAAPPPNRNAAAMLAGQPFFLQNYIYRWLLPKLIFIGCQAILYIYDMVQSPFLISSWMLRKWLQRRVGTVIHHWIKLDAVHGAVFHSKFIHLHWHCCVCLAFVGLHEPSAHSSEPVQDCKYRVWCAMMLSRTPLNPWQRLTCHNQWQFKTLSEKNGLWILQTG